MSTVSRTVALVALALAPVLVACRVHVPRKPCEEVILGACVERSPARTECERGRARSLDDGACLTTRDARELARGAGVFVDEADTVTCEKPEEEELVASVRLGKIGCVERDRRPPPCPEGTVREGRDGACGRVRSSDDALDLARWTRAAAVELCGALVRSPVALAAPETALVVELTASVPNNDLTLAFARARVSGADVAPADVERALRPIDAALRQSGGTANATDVTAAANCRLRQRRPISLP